MTKEEIKQEVDKLREELNGYRTRTWNMTKELDALKEELEKVEEDKEIMSDIFGWTPFLDIDHDIFSLRDLIKSEIKYHVVIGILRGVHVTPKGIIISMDEGDGTITRFQFNPDEIDKWFIKVKEKK